MNQQLLIDQEEFADVETSADDYAWRFSGSVGEFFLDLQTQITLELLKPWPKAKVLDIGGGHGQLAGPLIEAGYEVTVAGSQPVCEERLRRLLSPGSYSFIWGNLLSLPLEDNSFDVVLSFRLLPHVEAWPDLISECCRLARKAVIVDYPDLRSVNIFSKLFFQMKKAIEKNTRPFTCFSRREIMAEFTRHHFSQFLLRPEFFLPMALHRALKSGTRSRQLEAMCGRFGLTDLLGSPIILRVTRE
jgi:2-polyprenyl-3-methyl-5-hydroxy-6-metoxy-1,4-benzoquinol methylase